MTPVGMRIGEVARRTGIGTSTLRAWERRYKFLQPERSAAGHRNYTDADVERVEAVVRFVAEGRTVAAAIERASSSTVARDRAADEVGASLFSQILDIAGQGVWISKEGRTRYVNRRMAEIMGCSIDELMATPPSKFLAPGGELLVKEVGAKVRSGTRASFKQRLRRPDGTNLLAQVDAAPLFGQDGTYEGGVALVDDITAQAKADRETRFKLILLDSIGEAVAAADSEGKMVYANAAAERLFGWRLPDVAGLDGRILMPAQGAAEDATRVHQDLVAGRPFSGELRLARLDRSEFVAHLTSAPVFEDDGVRVGQVAVITDQTERQQLDRELRLLEVQAETLALLGVHALRNGTPNGNGVNELATEVVEAARRLLGADHVAILDVVDAKELRVRSASPPNARVTAVPMGIRSLPGYTTVAGRTVIVDNARDDPRFEPTQLWPNFRAASAISAPIFGPGGAKGVLIAESGITANFGPTAGHFLQGLANTLGSVLSTEVSGPVA